MPDERTSSREANSALNLEERRQGRRVLRSLPTQIWLALTSRCNLDCLHCPRDPKTTPDIDLSEQLLTHLERNLFPTLETLALGGNNLAEQFLSRNITRVLEGAAARGVQVRLTTNATILHPRLIAMLVEQSAVLQISLEGTGRAYQAIRQAPWSKLERFLEEVNHARERFPTSRARVVLAFTAFAGNLSELPEVIRFAAACRADQVHVQNLKPAFPHQRLQSLVYHRTAANAAFARAARLARRLGVDIHLPPPFPVGDMETSREQGTRLEPCFFPWTAANILENGDVVPCCIATSMIMGNLHDHSLEAIWNGRAYQRLRATVNSDRPEKDCARCTLRGGNDPDAILTMIDASSLRGQLKLELKKFLLRHGRQDMLVRLIGLRGWARRLQVRAGLG